MFRLGDLGWTTRLFHTADIGELMAEPPVAGAARRLAARPAAEAPLPAPIPALVALAPVPEDVPRDVPRDRAPAAGHRLAA